MVAINKQKYLHWSLRLRSVFDSLYHNLLCKVTDASKKVICLEVKIAGKCSQMSYLFMKV